MARIADIGATLGLLAFAFACAAAPAEHPGAAAPPPLPPPPRPARCVDVGTAAELAAALASARPGDALCLARGEYRGERRVPEGVTLWGPREAVLKTAGQGTTVTLTSSSALLGLTVDGSGGRFDVVDAAVRLNGVGAEVRGVAVRNSVFGILAERARGVKIIGNHVRGTGSAALGLRGDGIRLWETQHGVVEDNVVEEARDCVVWYSSDNVVRRNLVTRGRYGLHFMYSHRNEVQDNRFVSNEVAIFVMYSRELSIERNLLLHSRGPAGMGLGAKESGSLRVVGNVIADNTQGIFLDNSPLDDSQPNLFEGNDVRMSDVGIGFLSSQKSNTFRRNRFRDNHTVVRVDGGGDALGVSWVENHWDGYAGYDLDEDGFGDIPFELRDLSGALEAKVAALSFLRGTPALALVSVAGEVVPLLAPKAVLRDERPRFSSEVAHAD